MGGRIEPIASRRQPADAVAVRNGRIVAVGTTAEIREWIGRTTEVVALDGGTLLPGFQDAHVHPISGGLLANRCDLHDLPTRRRISTRSSDGRMRTRSDRGSSGEGWSLTAFPNGEPGRSALDAIVGNRPALLSSNDGHVAWVSSRALELAGVTAPRRIPMAAGSCATTTASRPEPSSTAPSRWSSG